MHENNVGPGRDIRRWAAWGMALAALAVAQAQSSAPAAAAEPDPRAQLDFSSAGYAGGAAPIPFVPAKYAVAPSGADDTAAIQAALDAVAALPPDANGFRGAVLLQHGQFRVAGQLKLTASGVVLRGAGATLVATGESRRTLIQISGRADRVVAPGTHVAADARAGATTLTVASVAGFAPSTRVAVRRPSTREWIAALGMTNFPGPGQYKDQRLDWVPGSRDLVWERTILAVDPATRTLTLDAPITTAVEARFGGATVSPLRWPGRIRQVGIEHLDCVGEVSPDNPLDEEHAWIAVGINAAEDVWVRDVTARRFVCTTVWAGEDTRAVTVQDCAFREPVAEHAAWRRIGFYLGGQQELVARCVVEQGRHALAAGHCSAGPNVFLDCRVTDAATDAGPFESWASGVLYDGVTVAGAGLALTNVGSRTQGAGWTAANSVVWNASTSSKIWVDDPPGATNRVYVSVETGSLYLAQREARGTRGTLAAADAPEHTELNVPAGPLPKPPPTRPVHPLTIVNGWFVVDGRAVFGGSEGSALWKGQLVPGRERQVGTSPTRWAPGRVGPTLTEDLDALTDGMVAQRTAFYWSFPGLWYDRRRDDHSIAIREDADVWAPFFEPPWRLSGRGRNAMGLSRYDLTKFNPWFFSRLRELADECAAKGLIFGCQVYDNHNVEEAAAHWADFPWRPLNAVQDTGFPEPPAWENAAQNRHHIAEAFYDPTHPVRRRLHDAYLRHTLDVLGGSPNVLFTVGYQFAGPLRFQQYFLDTIGAWEREHGRRVHVALQTSQAVTDAILADPARAALVDVIDLRYWQYLPDGRLFAPDGKGKLAFRELRTEAFGRDPVMHSTPELLYRQVREYRDRYPGKAIICGHAGFGPIPVLMAGGAAAVVAESTPGHDGPPHDDAALLAFVSNRLADVLPRMVPVDGVTTDAWCLTDPGRVWLFYSLNGPAITLAKPLGSGAASAEWFDPRTGKTEPATVAAGVTTIAKPTDEPWLLLVR